MGRKRKEKSIIIGMTGGIGSGKSTVSQMFAALGAKTVDADRLCHEMLSKPTVVRRITKALGKEILGENGGVDHAVVADRVFGDAAALKELIAVLHPPVLREIKRMAAQTRREGGVLVIDAALLLESGLDEACDVLIYVYAPLKIRVVRARRDRGWSASEIKRREKFQSPVKEKRQKSDYIIETAKTRRHVLSQVKRMWRMLHEE